jgi:hypothetical protein
MTPTISRVTRSDTEERTLFSQAPLDPRERWALARAFDRMLESKRYQERVLLAISL